MDDRFLEDLKSRLDIRDIVGRYTELKKSGKSWKGKSPFRNEKTPSFFVDPDQNLWYDFGASEGGDLIRFIEKIENFTFHESIEYLAQQAGVEVPKTSGQKGPSSEEKKDLFVLHKKSADFFANQLQLNKKALSYLKNRGISAAAIKDWQLGYGGDESNGLTKHLLQNGFTREQIAESGVAFERNFGDKSMKDRFEGRLMIPICEPRNSDIVAFTGRDLSGKEKVAKYVNSPENPVYHKSKTLFGLDKARHEIREKDFVVLVEGNFDVVSAHMASFCNVVATCGTSLTEDHLRIIKRQTKNVYLAFDNDIAGKKATLRSVEMVLKFEMNPFIVDVVGGKDLDETFRKNPGIAGKSIENAAGAVEFLLERFALKNLGKGIEGEKKFLDSIFYFLRLLPRPIEVDHFLGQIAAKIGRAKALVEAEYQKFQSKKVNYQKPKFTEENKKVSFTREECFLGFLRRYWDQISTEDRGSLLELLQEKNPRIFLEKMLTEQVLADEESITLVSWEMYQSQYYGDDFNVAGTLESFRTKLAKDVGRQQKTQADLERFKRGA